MQRWSILIMIALPIMVVQNSECRTLSRGPNLKCPEGSVCRRPGFGRANQKARMKCYPNLDDCDPNPCLNDGTCIDEFNDYTCSCADGFTGKNCGTDIDDCDPNPCLNGGTCTDEVNDYIIMQMC